MKIFSAAQLHEADKVTAEKHNITSLDLMERAGGQIFAWLHQRMQGAQVPIHIFCGIGNNGGDGLVLGRLLIENGYNVTIYVANFTDKRSKCFLVNYDKVKNITKKWPILMTSEADFPEIHKDDIIIDAIFGIGLNRAPERWVKKLIQYLNKNKAFTLSIDMPSGMYANQALEDADAVITSNHTLAFQTPKFSFFLPETARFVPFFEVLDIGLDPEYIYTTEPYAQVISKPEAQQLYKPRDRFSYKGTHGHTLVVAGSYGKMGAAVLSTKASLKIGSGIVTTFIPKAGYTILQTSVPEAMVLTDDNENVLSSINYNFNPQCIAVGPGIGTSEQTVNAIKELFKRSKSPIVIDADGLNCIAEDKSLLKLIPKQSILTPHKGELERLIGTWKNDYDKIKKVKAFAKKYEVVVVIKETFTIVVFENKLYINTSGNQALATAGSGDVLTGIIAGLVSQGYDSLLASVLGVYLHGSAGVLASKQMGYEGVIASDIIDFIPDSYIELFKQEQAPQQEKTETK